MHICYMLSFCLFKRLIPTGLRAKAADDVGDLHSSVASSGPQHSSVSITTRSQCESFESIEPNSF